MVPARTPLLWFAQSQTSNAPRFRCDVHSLFIDKSMRYNYYPSMRTVFRDRHERLRYAKFVEVARRLRENPAIIADAHAFVLAHMHPDPSQRAYAKHWLMVLTLPVEMMIDKLLADSPEGDLLRDTAPPFGKGFTSREVAEIIDRLHA